MRHSSREAAGKLSEDLLMRARPGQSSVLGSTQFVEENYHRDGHLLVSCGCRDNEDHQNSVMAFSETSAR